VSTDEEKQRFRTIFLGCSSFVAVILLIIIERSLALTLGTMSEAASAFSYGSNLVLDPQNEGKIVHLQATTPPSLDGMPPGDVSFGVSAGPRDAVLQRVTEYCQWLEIKHSSQEKVGKEPDYCSQTSRQDSCEQMSCSGKSYSSCSGNSGCCRWREGADIYETKYSYSYMKGWRSARISSLFFDNPAAYNNPQRDPFPSTKFWPIGSVDLTGGRGGIYMDPEDMSPVLQAPTKVFLSPSTATKDYQALQEGFSEVSLEHFYSRVPQDGWNNPIIKAAVSFDMLLF